jgi:signal transduction histidine kinase
VSAAYLEAIRTEGLGECLCPEVFLSGHRMQARNTTQCPRMPHIVEGLTVPVAHACIPLRFESTSRGVLNVAARPGEQFTEEELAFFETLGHQICLAIERAGHLQAERRHFQESRQAYRELQSAQARIIQTEKMAVLGTFASGLAHEVRNPLNSITLQLSILERRAVPLQESLAVEIRGLTGIIREEIKRLDSLVGDFLQFSRTSRIQYQAADLGALIDEVVRLLRPEARATGVTLRRQRVGDPLPPVCVDAERIKQVVINLLRNAIEAMPDGGVVTAEDGLLAGKACLVIRDSGPGLPEGLDVFQLFVTTKPKGTGLGLAIAQQIVLEHGGEIGAESDPGGGARFTVALPLGPLDEIQETAS